MTKDQTTAFLERWSSWASRSACAEMKAELRALVQTAFREGFELAADEADVSTWDGWHVTAPHVDMEAARQRLEEEVATL